MRHLYAISDGAGAVKIGVSGKVQHRLRALQVSHARALTLICSFPVLEAKHAERYVHTLLADKRLLGEWFDITADEARTAIEAALGATAPDAPGFPLRCWRLRKRMTLLDVARLLQTTEATISRVESGANPPGRALETRLVALTGLNRDELLRPWDDRQRVAA